MPHHGHGLGHGPDTYVDIVQETTILLKLENHNAWEKSACWRRSQLQGYHLLTEVTTLILVISAIYCHAWVHSIDDCYNSFRQYLSSPPP